MTNSNDQPDQEWLVNQIAHVLRNPLFAAQVQTEAILFKASACPDLVRPAELLHTQLTRFGNLIDEMLLFGRPVNPSPAKTNVLSLLRNAVTNAVNAESTDVDLKVEIDVSPSDLAVFWDASLVSICLERIISNVLVHTDPPREVLIQARVGDETVAITVADSGPGFTPEMLSQATQPFFPQHRGRPGLGLAIALKMIRAHGGNMELASESVGATVRLTIPSS